MGLGLGGRGIRALTGLCSGMSCSICRSRPPIRIGIVRRIGGTSGS